jgi:hypothetical protein
VEGRSVYGRRGYFPAERGKVERGGKCREWLFPCRERESAESGYFSAERGKCKERKERGKVERGVISLQRVVISLQRGVSAKRVERGVSAKRVQRGVISLQREGKCREGVSAERGKVQRGVSAKRG